VAAADCRNPQVLEHTAEANRRRGRERLHLMQKILAEA
jgi:hypothetical protein